MSAFKAIATDIKVGRKITKGKRYEATAEFQGNVMLIDDTGREVVFFREEIKKVLTKI